MEQIKKAYKQYLSLNELAKFLINSLLLLSLWYIFYLLLRKFDIVNNIYQHGIHYLTQFLLFSTKAVLKLFGFEVYINGIYIWIKDTPGIFLEKGCLARNLLGLYCGFLLAYPGQVKNKLWYIPMGIAIINILNIIRLAAITYLVKCCPESVEINHHYVFKYAVFSVILLLWYFWIFKINGRKNTQRP